eukprot:m.330985 g.330985  ORF g.330985 m.330985 type:complete len:163 (+) comp20467_c0_seq4:119-607(+)
MSLFSAEQHTSLMVPTMVQEMKDTPPASPEKKSPSKYLTGQALDAVRSPNSLTTASMTDIEQLNEISPFDTTKKVPAYLDNVHKSQRYYEHAERANLDSKKAGKQSPPKSLPPNVPDNNMEHLLAGGYQNDWIQSMEQVNGRHSRLRASWHVPKGTTYNAYR